MTDTVLEKPKTNFRDWLKGLLDNLKKRALQEDLSNTANDYFFSLGSSVVMSKTINDSLFGLPWYIKMLYPENPASGNYLWFLDKPWISKLLDNLSPVNAGSNWVLTLVACYQFYAAENRNLDCYLNIFKHLFNAVVSTVLSVASLAALLNPLKLLIAFFSVNAAIGIYHFCRNIYRACTDKKARKKHFLNAVKSLVTIVTNTLANVITVYSYIASTLASTLSSLKTTGQFFLIMQPLLYTVTAAASLGLAADTLNLNQQTWGMIRHPRAAWKSFKEEFKQKSILEKFLTPLSLLINTATRLVAMVTTPLQLIGYGIKKALVGYYNSFHNKEPVSPTVKKPATVNIVNTIASASFSEASNSSVQPLLSIQSTSSSSQSQPIDIQPPPHLEEKKKEAFIEMVDKIDVQIKKLRAESPSKKRTAKIECLRDAKRQKLGIAPDTSAQSLKEQVDFNPDTCFKKQNECQLESLEKTAMANNRSVFYSFFKDVSVTKERLNDIREFESTFFPPAA